MTGDQALQHGVAHLYELHLLNQLKCKVRQKHAVPQRAAADVYRALHATHLWQFDNAITAPLHDFADAQDYYARSGSAQFSPDIRVPTFIVRTLDDPFFNPDTPFALIESNSFLVGHFPEYGGHVSFIKTISRHPSNNWAAQQSIAFLQHILQT